MPRLKNIRQEQFCKNCLTMTKSDAYREAFGITDDDSKNICQLASVLSKRDVIKKRIKELQDRLCAKSDKKLEDYLKLYNSIAFLEGEFAGKDIKIVDRMTAGTKAMKAQGIEGSDKVDVSGDGGFQLILSKECVSEGGDDDGDKAE